MIQGTYYPEAARLRGEWIADPKAPASGTIELTHIAQPSLLWPFRDRPVKGGGASSTV
jgi:hypothetical protein